MAAGQRSILLRVQLNTQGLPRVHIGTSGLRTLAWLFARNPPSHVGGYEVGRFLNQLSGFGLLPNFELRLSAFPRIGGPLPISLFNKPHTKAALLQLR